MSTDNDPSLIVIGTEPVPSFVRVHNRSIAMDMIRVNAEFLKLEPLDLLPRTDENVFLMVDERVVDVCLYRYNEEYGQRLGQCERTTFISDEYPPPE